MCISSTIAAILMTSSVGPDAELRWMNWFKLIHRPQSLCWYRSQKSSQNSHGIPIRNRLNVAFQCNEVPQYKLSMTTIVSHSANIQVHVPKYMQNGDGIVTVTQFKNWTGVGVQSLSWKRLHTFKRLLLHVRNWNKSFEEIRLHIRIRHRTRPQFS